MREVEERRPRVAKIYMNGAYFRIVVVSSCFNIENSLKIATNEGESK